MTYTQIQQALFEAFASKVSINSQTLTEQQQNQAQQNIGGPFLKTSGGSMLGSLILVGNPSQELEAVTKQYVDSGLSSISWDSLSGRPNFATVATTGNYNDLINRPSIPSTPNAYITQTWRSGAEWYRVYSDGFIEQGGKTGAYTNDVVFTVSLHRYFSSTNYEVFTNLQQTGLRRWSFLLSQATSYFRVENSGYSEAGNSTATHWFACGY